MPSRIFISCGQATDEDAGVASDLEKWFRSQGYDPYVAVQVQTIGDLNAGIIGALKASDYYLFINFPRETVIADRREWPSRIAVLTRRVLQSHMRSDLRHFLVVESQRCETRGRAKVYCVKRPGVRTRC